MEQLQSLVSRLRGGITNTNGSEEPGTAATDPPDAAAAAGAIDLEADDSNAMRALGEAVVRRHSEEAWKRLAIAQHWARAALCYEAAGLPDPWQPIVMGCAIAALITHDLAELARVLGGMVGCIGTDPRTANIWRAAFIELQETIEGDGLALEEPNNWAWPVLRTKLTDLLERAQLDAEHIRTVSMPPPAENS